MAIPLCDVILFLSLLTTHTCPGPGFCLHLSLWWSSHLSLQPSVCPELQGDRASPLMDLSRRCCWVWDLTYSKLNSVYFILIASSSCIPYSAKRSCQLPSLDIRQWFCPSFPCPLCQGQPFPHTLRYHGSDFYHLHQQFSPVFFFLWHRW